MFWRGIEGVLSNAQGSPRAEGISLLKACSLAPGLDGRIWPCGSAFRADELTCRIFASLIANNATFLERENVPLLEQLCPEFTAADAIKILSSFDAPELEARRRVGDYNPVDVLHWFELHKAELTPDLRKRLASLPIFPSAKNLRPLQNLWLPGGFEDLLGEAGILDSEIPASLFSFLRSLGIRQFTFEDYAMRYIPRAFAQESAVDVGTRRRLLATLERHIGEVKDNDRIRKALSEAWIVECDDGAFRQSSVAYFQSKEVKDILGNEVAYALVPGGSGLRRDLYAWLGVQARPRVTDMLQIVNLTTTTKPTNDARSTVTKMLEAFAERWREVGSTNDSSYLALKTRAWLPGEANSREWYKPDGLFAAFNKHLFATQANFLDVPVPTQQKTAGFLEWLGVKRSPKPFQVIRHLLEYTKRDMTPPSGIYRWLNDNAKAPELQGLRSMACLRVQGRYLPPNQVFWGSHPFGRFRIQLGSELRSYQNLLEALGVREKPDFNDAFNVLDDISKHVGSRELCTDEKEVVHRCWIMLSEALERENLAAGTLKKRLGNVRCTPTNQGFLQRPSWMFFEDRPGLADKFPGELNHNCIPRTERVWKAMGAAGIKSLSEVVLAYVEDCVNPHEDNDIPERISGRLNLIRTILEGPTGSAKEEDLSSILDNMRFIHADHLTVRWRLLAFDKEWPDSPPEAALAHWDSAEKAVFFTNRSDGTPPWSAIARELTLALAPGDKPASISPGLKSILEADTTGDAVEQLNELGIAFIQTLNGSPVEGSVARELGDDGDATNGDNRIPRGRDEPDDWFARQLHGEQNTAPSTGPDNPVLLPPGGPDTQQSARDYTNRSNRVGRTEPHVLRLVARSERGPRGRALEDEFRSMVEGDYGKRCQICTRTFTTAGGGLQVNVVHVVPPRRGYPTNHFGDLLGLCGWHFSLLRYGEWALLDDGNQPFWDADGTPGWERMRQFILNRSQETDCLGNTFIGLPIRFSNVYQEWQPEPTQLREKIRYSLPHWEFLCALLRV